MMRYPLAALAATALALPFSVAPVAAQERILTIFGEDKCPADTICVRAPESERYRIPKELRESVPSPAGQSWSSRFQSMEYAGRGGTDSCSPTGAGGWTGCYNEMVRKAYEERRLKAYEDANRPAPGD